MKKFLVVFLSVFLAQTVWADACSKALTGIFPAAQATKLCSFFGPGTTAAASLASAGSDQGTAAAVTARSTIVSGADGTKGIILPATPTAGEVYLFVNSSGSVLKVYPGSGDSINALSANTALQVTTQRFFSCFAQNASTWFCNTETDFLSPGKLYAYVGDIISLTSGGTLALQEATAGAKCMGTVTANGTTAVTVSTTCATTGSRILLTRSSAPSGTAICWQTNIVNGVSFDLDCSGAETGTFDWFILHEA